MTTPTARDVAAADVAVGGTHYGPCEHRGPHADPCALCLKDRLVPRVAAAIARERERAAGIADAAATLAETHGDAARRVRETQWAPGAQSTVVATWAHVAQACLEIAAAIRQPEGPGAQGEGRGRI